jgi:hypothetical protein
LNDEDEAIKRWNGNSFYEIFHKPLSSLQLLSCSFLLASWPPNGLAYLPPDTGKTRAMEINFSYKLPPHPRADRGASRSAA